MSSRRLKRKPANQSQEEGDVGVTDGKNKRKSAKGDKGGTTSEDGPADAKSGDRRSARKKLAAVNYQEDGNDSDNDFEDVGNESNDSEYTAPLPEMSSRRLKRKPANQSQEEGDVGVTDGKNKRKSAKGGTTSEDRPPDAKSGDRRSAREKLAAVNYQEDGNGSDNDFEDVGNESNDSEYTAPLPEMSSRRLKRKPANQSQEEGDVGVTDGKNKRISAKSDKGGTTSEDRPPDAKSGDRRSAREKLAAVNYQEDGNGSDNDFEDVGNESNDSEYTGPDDEENKQDLKNKSNTRRGRTSKAGLVKGGDDRGPDSDEDSDSVSADAKKTIFEVSELQTEINLSSDDDSGDEDVSARTGGSSRGETDSAKNEPLGKETDSIGGSRSDNVGLEEESPKVDSNLSSSDGDSDVEDEVHRRSQMLETVSSSSQTEKVKGNDNKDVDNMEVSESRELERDPVKSSPRGDIPSKKETNQSNGIDTATTSSPYFASKKQLGGKAVRKRTKRDGSVVGLGEKPLSEELCEQKQTQSDDDGDVESGLDGEKLTKGEHRGKVFQAEQSGKKASLKLRRARLGDDSMENSIGGNDDKRGKIGSDDEHGQPRSDIGDPGKKKKAVVNLGRRKSIQLSEDTGLKTEDGEAIKRKRPRRVCRKSPARGGKKGKTQIEDRSISGPDDRRPSSSGLKGAQNREETGGRGGKKRKTGAEDSSISGQEGEGSTGSGRKRAPNRKETSGRSRVQSAGKAKLKKPAGEVDDMGTTGEAAVKRYPDHPAGKEGISESSDDEWEDVEDVHIDGSGTPRKKRPVDKPTTSVVEIDIELPGAESKRKKAYDWADYYRRELNRVKKEQQIEIHKVHLLCLLANGFHRNSVCNEDLLLSTALSIIPPDVAKVRPKKLNMNFIYKLLFWYRKHFGINSSLPRLYRFPVYQILQGMQAGVFSSEEEFVMVFVLCIRCLWGDARLVLSLQPMTWKAKIVEKNSKSKTTKSPSSGLAPGSSPPSSSKTSSKKLGSHKSPKTSSIAKKSKTSGRTAAERVPKSEQKTPVSSTEKSALSTTLRTESGKLSRKRKGVLPKGEHEEENDSDVVLTRKVEEESKFSKSEGQRSSHGSTVKLDTAGAGRRGTRRGRVQKEETEDGSRDGAVDVDPKGVRKGQPRKSSGVSKTRKESGDPGITKKKESSRGNESMERPKRTKISNTKSATEASVSARNGSRDIGWSRGKYPPKKNEGKLRKSNVEEDAEVGNSMPGRSLRKRKATRRKQMEHPSNDESENVGRMSDEGSNYSEKEWIHQKKASKKKKKSVVTHNTSRGSIDRTLSSDSDFEDEIENLSMKSPRSASKPAKELNNSILSSESEESVKEVKCIKTKKTVGVDVWCEVFLPAQNLWVSVDCMQGYVNKPHELETRATQPLLYVLGFDNDNSAKDLTQRYASRWMAHNIKLRIEEDWWQQTLSAYKSKKKKRDKDEDAQMQTHHLDQPLPKSIVEYKNHPLYALERHFLKFEAIYPPSAAVLGYCKGEPVYSRECVHTLKSIHTWMKEGIAVKDGEKPYKFVKKLINPFKRHLITPEEQNQMLDIYGEWQTELFVPPPAKDGIVPRNEYGNVELFTPTMLPKGTVHLKISGLNKVASKLDIDCAPAMMGWEFHKRFTVPILEGFVVCEEVADVLVAAWEEERVEIEKKKKLKREQKAMKNWKHLIRSLLIRERLKERYQLEEEPPAQTAKGKGKGKTKAHWPENKMTAFKGDASNLLPFEKRS